MTKESMQLLVEKVAICIKLGDEISALKQEMMQAKGIGVYLVTMPSGTVWAITIKKTGHNNRGTQQLECSVKPTVEVI